MAVPVRVPRLGSDEAEARVAEWYQPDGSAVRRGQPVYRLETDFAAVEVEAEEDGVLRHQAAAGTLVVPGNVVAFITSPGEGAPKLPAPSGAQAAAPNQPREQASPAEAEPAPPPPLVSPRSRARARALAAARATPPPDDAAEAGRPPSTPSALRAAAERVSAAAADPVELSEWEPAPEPDEDEPPAHPASVLLFPRLLSDFRKGVRGSGDDDADDAADRGLRAGGHLSPRGQVSAWDLVPGENDFNPEWITERGESPEAEPKERASSRFQASNIRSLALGRKERPDGEEARAAEAAAPAETEAAPPAAEPAPAPSTKKVHRPAPPPEDVVVERREDHAPGQLLFLRVSVDMGEAVKMRDQLTREWWGSNVRPTNEDIVLRAIARVLEQSAAFRRSSDLVGMRSLAGGPRSVHVLSDAATRPFRDAVAGLAALRARPATELPCICTLTSFAEFDLDAGAPALPAGQSLAISMGAVRDVPRYRGDHLYRATEVTLTMLYDSDAVPAGAAARLLARVRELVEAPYALLAH